MQDSRRSLRLVAILACLLVTSGCGFTSTPAGKPPANPANNGSRSAPSDGSTFAHTESYSSADANSSISFTHTNDVIELKLSGSRGEHDIALKALAEQDPDKPYRVYQLTRLLPEQPVDAENLKWFFRTVGTDVAIQTKDMVLIVHPDLPIIEEWLEKLKQETNIAQLTAAWPKLIRADSRAKLLATAARSPALDAPSVEQLIDVAAAGRTSPMFFADGEGIPPDYDAAALSQLVMALAERADLTAAQADRLAAGCGQLEFDYYESNSLIALSRKATLEAILKSSENIVDGQLRHLVLLEEARRDPLPVEQADKIAAAVPGVNYDYYEQVVLLGLTKKASPGALLAAAAEIVDGQLRHQVLLEMIGRPDFNAALAAQIAQATPQLAYDYYECQVLKTLSGKAPVKTILENARQIVDGQMHYEVILAIINTGSLDANGADEIARACPAINFDYYESQALMTLAPLASTSALIENSQQIADGEMHYNVLAAVARKEGITAAEATQLANAAQSINFDFYEAALLKELAQRATIESLVAAAKNISDGNMLYEVLLKATEREQLSSQESLQILASTAQVNYDNYQQDLLQRLAPRAPVASILEAAEHVQDATAKYNVLLTLCKLETLAAEDADKIAAAVEHVSYGTYQADVLLALRGRASDQALKQAARFIREDADRLRVLDALNQ